MNARRARGASRRRPTAKPTPAVRRAPGAITARAATARPNTWLRLHAQSALTSLQRLLGGGLGSALTVAVIAVALSLPALMYVAIDNLRTVGNHWDGAVRISLFLELSVSEGAAKTLAEGLRQRPGVRAAEYISREQALAEFRQRSEFAGALDALEENPLPAVLIVVPEVNDDRRRIQKLADSLSGLPEVELAQMDREWLQRFFAILAIAERAVMVLTVLLAAAVILIIGNTIRLDLQSRRQEIEVQKLIGATDAFIRRPFLYTGLWYGIAGALLATLLVTAGRLLLMEPVQRLADLYASDFHLRGLGLYGTLLLFALGITLGLTGAWLSVRRRLRRIEPQ